MTYNHTYQCLQVRDAGTQLGLKVHLDGARIGNALISLQCKPHDITQYVDSASICLSKVIFIY